jgi:hypothetical protein
MTVFKLMETAFTLTGAVIRTDGILNQILQHCHDWIDHFSATLLAETTGMIDDFYEYMMTNSAR